MNSAEPDRRTQLAIFQKYVSHLGGLFQAQPGEGRALYVKLSPSEKKKERKRKAGGNGGRATAAAEPPTPLPAPRPALAGGNMAQAARAAASRLGL